AVARQHQTTTHVVHREDDALGERGVFIHPSDGDIVGRPYALEVGRGNGGQTSGPLGDRRDRRRGHHLERRRVPRPELEGQGSLVQEKPQPTEDGGTALARGRLHRRDGRVIEEIDDEGRIVDRRQRQLLAISTEGGRVDDQIGRGRRRVLERRDDEFRREPIERLPQIRRGD